MLLLVSMLWIFPDPDPEQINKKQKNYGRTRKATFIHNRGDFLGIIQSPQLHYLVSSIFQNNPTNTNYSVYVMRLFFNR